MGLNNVPQMAPMEEMAPMGGAVDMVRAENNLVGPVDFKNLKKDAAPKAKVVNKNAEQKRDDDAKVMKDDIVMKSLDIEGEKMIASEVEDRREEKFR